MPEVAVACGDERDSILVAAVYNVLVPHASTRMGDCCNARLACLLH